MYVTCNLVADWQEAVNAAGFPSKLRTEASNVTSFADYLLWVHSLGDFLKMDIR